VTSISLRKNTKGIHLDSDIIVKNGRITKLDDCNTKDLNDIVMSIIWPPLAPSSASLTTRDRMVACGAYIGTSPSEVCKRLGCDDMTVDVMDFF
jgi:hypothetical protein